MGQVYSHLSEEERHDPPLPAQTHARHPSMARELQEIVDETDNRPMRVLGHRTPPAEAFADELLEPAENKDVALTNR